MDEEEQLEVKQLIDEEYSYENIIKNPILKAIAETDRTLIDLMEMAYKKTIDASKDKKEINEIIQDIPAYQTSNLVNKLIRRNQEIDDLIKIQNLIIRNLRRCIKEVYSEVIKNYGVNKKEVEGVQVEIDYLGYLTNLLNKDDFKKKYIQLILNEFKNDKSTIEDKRKFVVACGKVYSKMDEKGKIIVAKIRRMEY